MIPSKPKDCIIVYIFFLLFFLHADRLQDVYLIRIGQCSFEHSLGNRDCSLNLTDACYAALLVLEPRVVQSLTCSQPLLRIEMRQSRHQIFQPRTDVLPERDWLARVCGVESISQHRERRHPRAVSEAFEETFQAIRV